MVRWKEGVSKKGRMRSGERTCVRMVARGDANKFNGGERRRQEQDRDGSGRRAGKAMYAYPRRVSSVTTIKARHGGEVGRGGASSWV